nr:ATP-binding protein [Acidiphilium sp. PA]
MRYARLGHNATIEDVDYRNVRGLDRALFQKLIQGHWIDALDNLVLSIPTGMGKSWLACAVGRKACRDDGPALYQRAPRLFTKLAVARAEGRHGRMIRTFGAVSLLILADFGLAPLDAGAPHDLLEIVEERYGRRSTIVTSQIPPAQWHEVIGDPPTRTPCSTA